MMGDFDNDVDLEELEERLYSQIYHSTIEEEPQIPQEPESEETPKQTYGKPRYYEETVKTNYYLKNRIQEKLTNTNEDKDPVGNIPITETSTNNENVNPSGVNEFNAKQDVAINKHNTTFNIPQYINLSSKGENNTLNQNKSSNLNRRARAKFKKINTEIRYLNIDKSKILDNYEFIKQTAPYKLRKLKIINKRLRYLINKKLKFKDDKADMLINKHNEDLYKEVVQISSGEDDNDMVIVIKDKAPVKAKFESKCVPDEDDDVVFVKQIFSKIETIVIDPETQKTDSELMKPPSDIETSSVASSNSSNLDRTSKPHSTPQVELIGTPESTNDFLDNPMEMNQDKFNFALHGSEFGTPQSSKFLKPKPLHEVYESESSCSASDISTPYKQFSSVFSENDFDTSKEMFNESNLETFSKLITPKRKPVADKIFKTKTNEFEQIKTKVNKNSSSTCLKTNSDSSSESEYEDTKIIHIERKNISSLNKNLTEVLATEIPKDVQNKHSKKKNKKSIQVDEIDDHTKCLQDLTEKRRKRKSLQFGKVDDVNNEVNVVDGSAKKSKTNKTKNVDENIKVEEDSKKGDIKTKKRKKTRTDFSEELVNAIQEDNMNGESSMQDVIEVINPQSNTLIDLTTDDSDILEIEDFIVIDECGDSDDEEKKPEVGCSKSNCETEVVNGKSDDKQKSKNRRSFTDFWTEDMDKFYAGWGLENFNLDESLKAMSGDPEKWKILDSDRLHIPTNRRGVVCRKCGERGHVYTRAGYCPNSIPKCFLCGEAGHFEPRCPNKICTTCGVKSNYSTNYCSKCAYLRDMCCKICYMRGHKEDMCPDTWRRYHLTTEEGPLVKPAKRGINQLKPSKDQWCSGCALSGHLEYQCRYYNRMYAPTLPYIVDYTDVYGTTQEPDKDSIDFSNDIVEGTNINNVYDVYASNDLSNHLKEPNVQFDYRINEKLPRKSDKDYDYRRFIRSLHIEKKKKKEMNHGPNSTIDYINIDNSNSVESKNITNINIKNRKTYEAPPGSFPRKPNDIALKISTSLNNLKDWSIKEDCCSIYENILDMEKNPEMFNKEDLEHNFIKLNSMLVTKYNVIGQQGKKKLKILRKWLSENQDSTAKHITHSKVNHIRNAYYFIFDKRRKEIDYNDLLRKVQLKC